MKDIRGIKGKFYIASLIEEGEHEHQDFKFAVSDARKIAHSLSAFANNDGGRLLIGVKDNGAIAGVRNEEDIFVVEQAAEMYCEPPQEIKVTAFKAEGGHTVMRVEIGRAPIRPVHVKETGGELRAYYRVRDENIAAPPLLVRAWKHASGNEGSIIEVNSQGAHAFLRWHQKSDGVTIEGFMLAAHVSRQTAEDIAVSLYGMGLIEFMYNGTCFTLKSL